MAMFDYTWLFIFHSSVSISGFTCYSYHFLDFANKEYVHEK